MRDIAQAIGVVASAVERDRPVSIEVVDPEAWVRRLTRREIRWAQVLIVRGRRRGGNTRRELRLYEWLRQRALDRPDSELSWWQLASREEADARWAAFKATEVDPSTYVCHPVSHRQEPMQERRRFRRSRARGSSVVAEPVEVAAPPVLVEAEPEPEVVYVPPTPPADVLSTTTRPAVRVRTQTRSLRWRDF